MGKRNDMNESLFVTHEYLHSGKSSFERYWGKKRTEDVFENLYMNFKCSKRQGEWQPAFDGF